MIPVTLGTMPPDGPGRWAWVRDAFNKITAASKRDDTIAKLATLYASETYNPASINAGAFGGIETIAVSGAAVGMRAEATFSLDLQGLGINAWVSAPDTVSYQFHNLVTGAPVDLASGTVRVRVWTYLP